MKKIYLSIMLILLTGCEAKQEYEQAVLEQMQQEKDIKDYKIDPVKMAKCVVGISGTHMPGMFPFDPDRMTAYKNYTKMLKLNNANDPKKTLEELRVDFGSAKGLADAHSNYTESMVECITSLVSETEEEQNPEIKK
jgi:hypothetical protein